MKVAIRRMLRALGYDIVHVTRDPVLREMIMQHEFLRLTQPENVAWCHLPPQVADLAALRRLLLVQNIDLVVDVGANEGQFARHLRDLGYHGDIVSFEPADGARRRLIANAANDTAWKVRPEGLGRASGTGRLRILANDVFSSFYIPNSEAHRIFGEEVREVAAEAISVVPLDLLWTEIAGNCPRRVMLKIDTQGHDLEVLAGAAHALTSTRVLLTEGAVLPLYAGAPRYTDLITQAEAAGFVLAGLYSLAHRPTDQALLEINCLFTRPGE